LESEIYGATLSALPLIVEMIRGLPTNGVALFDEASEFQPARGDSLNTIEIDCERSARC
jgi:hypothetical protein